MEIKKEIAIDLKSEPMNEMLSNPPSWIVRSGNGLFFILLLLSLLLSWMIQYPDEITGDVILSTKEAPIELTNQSYLQLKSIKIKDKQRVHQGQLLAEFDNRANAEDIKIAQFLLQKLVDIYPNNKIASLPTELQLGTYQNQWETLQFKIEEWNALQEDDLSGIKVKTLEKEISFRKQLQEISNRKIKLAEKDYLLVNEELKSSERLAKGNNISNLNLNIDRKNETQSQQTIQNLKEQNVQNLIQMNVLEKELKVLKHEIKSQQEKLINELKLAVITLKNSLLDWENSAIWLSPCDGLVLFNKQLQLNKFYTQNQASIIIVPEVIGYSAIATIPSEGAGKVEKGQKTTIELLDFPKTEFGLIEGRVLNITQIDKEGKYEVKIELPKKLKTSFNKKIPMKAQLRGKVRIITKKMRLLVRLFEKVIGKIK